MLPVSFKVDGDGRSNSSGNSSAVAGQSFTKSQKTALSVSQTVLYALRLGWINCDRFTNQSNLVDFNFKSKVIGPLAVYIIYHSINAVQTIYFKLGRKVPVGEKVTIFVVGEKDGKQYVCIQETVLSASPVVLSFKEYDPKKIDDLVAQLKWK